MGAYLGPASEIQASNLASESGLERASENEARPLSGGGENTQFTTESYFEPGDQNEALSISTSKNKLPGTNSF